MKPYNVKIALTYHKELDIYASNEEEAEEKALEICSKWAGVEDCETIEITEA